MGQSTPFRNTVSSILLIDNNDNDRLDSADRIRLGMPDCHVLEARDGKAGLELYKSHSVDCIVSELHLPDMSGFELLLQLVPRASEPEVAFIVLARAAWKTLADIAKSNGAQAYLVKHVTSGDELVFAIQKAMAAVGPMRKDRRAKELGIRPLDTLTGQS